MQHFGSLCLMHVAIDKPVAALDNMFYQKWNVISKKRYMNLQFFIFQKDTGELSLIKKK